MIPSERLIGLSERIKMLDIELLREKDAEEIRLLKSIKNNTLIMINEELQTLKNEAKRGGPIPPYIKK